MVIIHCNLCGNHMFPSKVTGIFVHDGHWDNFGGKHFEIYWVPYIVLISPITIVYHAEHHYLSCQAPLLIALGTIALGTIAHHAKHPCSLCWAPLLIVLSTIAHCAEHHCSLHQVPLLIVSSPPHSHKKTSLEKYMCIFVLHNLLPFCMLMLLITEWWLSSWIIAYNHAMPCHAMPCHADDHNPQMLKHISDQRSW